MDMNMFLELAKQYNIEFEEGQMTDEDIKYFMNIFFDSKKLAELEAKATELDRREKGVAVELRIEGIKIYSCSNCKTTIPHEVSGMVKQYKPKYCHYCGHKVDMG